MDAWSHDRKKPKMRASAWANPPSSVAIGLIVIKWWFGPPTTRCTTTCLEGWCVPSWNLSQTLKFIPSMKCFSTFDHCSTWTLSRCAEPFESASSNGLAFPFRLVSHRPRRWPSWPIALPKKIPPPKVCSNFPKPIPIELWRWIRSMWEMFGVLVHAGAPSFEALASVPPWTWPACPPMTCEKDSMSWPNERRWNFEGWCVKNSKTWRHHERHWCVPDPSATW